MSACGSWNTEEEETNKPPAIKIKAIPTFRPVGTFIGRSIQIGRNRMARSVATLHAAQAINRMASGWQPESVGL